MRHNWRTKDIAILKLGQNIVVTKYNKPSDWTA